MHKFTDVDITDSGVMELCHPDDFTIPVVGVYITSFDINTECHGTAFLSKEDLLYLLKLIEETN